MTILAMVILGGLGNIYGVVIGALLIGSFDRILADELTTPLNRLGEAIGWPAMANHNLTSDRFLVFGLALVLIMLFRPGGLLPSNRRRAEMETQDPSILLQENESMFDVANETVPVERSQK